jgi:hypothetical protein
MPNLSIKLYQRYVHIKNGVYIKVWYKLWFQASIWGRGTYHPWTMGSYYIKVSVHGDLCTSMSTHIFYSSKNMEMA